ncbi:MAG: HEAT repeat domain-containing protein [Phycisphaerales bacterium JB050]
MVLDHALSTLASDGRESDLGAAILTGWKHYSLDEKASVCLGMGDRFLVTVLGLDSGVASPIAADCLGHPELAGVIVGNDPFKESDFVALGIGFGHAQAGDGERWRRALARTTLVCQQDSEGLPNSVHAVLDRELVAWAGHYAEHRDASVLRAVLAATRRCGPRLHAWLLRGPLEEHLPLRAAAAKAELTIVAGLALAWLAWPCLVPASRRVIERVVSTDDAELFNAMLEPWALLRSRRRGDRLRTVLSDQQFSRLANKAGLSEHAKRGLPVIASELGTGAVAALAQTGLVASRDAQARLGLVHAIAGASAGEEADLTLQDLGFDPQPTVSIAAIGAMGRIRSRHRRIASSEAIETLTRCQHERGRAKAQRALERFDPLSGVRSEASRWHCPVAAKWLSVRSPDTLEDLLRGALRVPDQCQGAMGLIDRLSLVSRFGAQLCAIASGASDPRCRASATRLLGESGDDVEGAERAFRTLAELLGDSDHRVRANAIEAISRLRGASIRLDRFASDPVARVRANAIRHACSLLEAKQQSESSEFGMMHLDAMLRDDRSGHRLSAVWVTSVVRPVELAGPIAQMAREDADPTVRSRARRCAMRLLSAMEPQRQEVGVA